MRGGIKQVVIPQENERELKEIPGNIKQGLEITPVRWIDEVLAIALHRMPEPLPVDEADDGSVAGDSSDQDEDSDVHRHH